MSLLVAKKLTFSKVFVYNYILVHFNRAIFIFLVMVYSVCGGEAGCPGGLRAVSHAQSFCICDMEKGNKSQMPTDIHKHMAHTTRSAL